MTMVNRDSYELIKKARETRAVTLEIILLVGAIGVLLGVFSNAIFSILWEPMFPHLSQIILIISILVLILSLIWKVLDSVYFQSIGEEKQIKILLPLLVTLDYLLVRELKSYDVTRVANEITKKVFRHEEYKGDKHKFKEEFSSNSDPFRKGFVRNITLSLVQYLCLYYLGRAGEDSLGFSAPYHNGGYFPSLNPQKEKVQLDDSLKRNYFIDIF